MPVLRGRELAAYLIFSALWSSNWLVIRIGLKDLPPFVFAGLRLLLASVLLAAAFWLGAAASDDSTIE